MLVPLGPHASGGHLITPFGQLTLRLRNSSCGFWTSRGERLPLLDFACEEEPPAVVPLHFFVGAGNAGVSSATIVGAALRGRSSLSVTYIYRDPRRLCTGGAHGGTPLQLGRAKRLRSQEARKKNHPATMAG